MLCATSSRLGSMLSKKAAQNKHAKKRAEERFGLKLNKTDIRQIVSCIQEKRDSVTFVKTISNRISVWRVALNDAIALALYDKKRKNIVTFLPETYEV